MKFAPKKMVMALAASALLFAGACTTGDETTGTGGDGDAQVELVGLMVQDLSNPFFAAMQNRMEEVADEQGFTLNVQDGRQDLAAQNDQIDAFIQQGVDVILINPVDSEGIGSAVERAKLPASRWWPSTPTRPAPRRASPPTMSWPAASPARPWWTGSVRRATS